MTADAVYAWKSRIGKVVRKLAAEFAASEPRPAAATVEDASRVSERPAPPRRSEEETR
jgi:hypothetical protein